MAPPPELLEELVGEILLRLPPEEPINLLRASLVCKPWCRLLSDLAFGRRYRQLHRTPPVLGFFHNLYDSGPIPRFVSTVASPCSQPALNCDSCWVLDCRHGRVLMHRFAPTDLVVFDPLTCGQQRLPLPPYPHTYYTGAVLCAVAGCDHLDCNGGPFLVVFVGTDEDDGLTWASVYSSEIGSWGASVSVELDYSHIEAWPSVLVGDSLYFMLAQGMGILSYNLAGRGLSVMDVPAEYEEMGTVVMVEDGRLGFTGVEDLSLHLWSWEDAGGGCAGWKRCRVIELTALLTIPDMNVSLEVVGFVEGTDVVFLSTGVGIFTLEIKSGRVAKVGEKGAYFAIVPYTGFYLPGV